jgi:hypothetical protein
MMFGLWRRRGGRGFLALRLISFGLALVGFLVAFANTFLTPVEVVTDSRTRETITVTATSTGTIALFIVPLLFLAIGVGLGFYLRRNPAADKSKNEEVVEKKKKRLESPVYAHTVDGETLEVVEDDEHSDASRKVGL